MITVVLSARVDDGELDLGYVMESEDEDNTDVWRSSTTFMREMDSLERRFPSILNIEVNPTSRSHGFSQYKITIDLLSKTASVVSRVVHAIESMRAVRSVMLVKKT